jgi:hypothetical protein
MNTTAAKETEYKGRKSKKQDSWYNEECQNKERARKLGLKQRKKRDDDESTERHWKCRNQERS